MWTTEDIQKMQDKLNKAADSLVDLIDCSDEPVKKILRTIEQAVHLLEYIKQENN